MNLKNNETQFFNTFDIENETDIKSQLEYLNKKIDDLNRQVSFWDIYNVTQIIKGNADLAAKIPLLSIGEAAIVNVNVVSDEFETHHRGDIAYKMPDGSIEWIPAENKGVYKPSLSYVNGNIKLVYSYSTDFNNVEETIRINTENSYLYSAIFEFDGDEHYWEIPVCKYGNDILKPIVKFFIKKDEYDSWEECYIDYNWTILNNNIIHIEIPNAESKLWPNQKFNIRVR